MRTRLGVEKSFEEIISFLVHFQDSRVLGEEPNTLTAIDNIVLHQGFIKLNKLFGWDWLIQAGRFEVSYGTERFIGPVGWNYVGRSFDGVRFTISPAKWDLDLFALILKESVAYISIAAPSNYPYPLEPTSSTSIYGIWKKNSVNEAHKFDVFGYYEVNREKVGTDTCRLSMLTAGASYWGNFGSFFTLVEGAYQFGEMVGMDISAYTVSAQMLYSLNFIKAGLGVDILSGTYPADVTEINTYQASYGTNHKFYGFMDYFINIPNNTMNLGLNDFYLLTEFSPPESGISIGINFHHFMSNEPFLKTGQGDPTPTEESGFGQEIDITAKYNFIKGTTISWGGSLFFPGELIKIMFYPREDVAFWSYLMITANF